MPAFPHAEGVNVRVITERYRTRSGGFVTLTDGETITRNLTLHRCPSRWRARFTDVDDDRTILAKTAMLNLFAKLADCREPVGGQRSWFSFIDKILEIDRERFIAKADPEMRQIVKAIRKDIHDYRDYKKSPARNHAGNVAEQLKRDLGYVLV